MSASRPRHVRVTSFAGFWAETYMAVALPLILGVPLYNCYAFYRSLMVRHVLAT